MLVFVGLFFKQEVTFCQVLTINKKYFDTTDNISFLPLKKQLEGVDVISLGEQTHDVGATFIAKYKLIKYLHDSLGYNVLVFESGFYDCLYADKVLKGEDYKNDLFKTLFGVWHCKELKPLLSYVHNTQKTRTPIIYAGMDVQLLRNSQQHLLNEISKLIDSLNRRYNTNISYSQSFGESVRRQIYSSNRGRLSVDDTVMLHDNYYSLLYAIEKYTSSSDIYFGEWKQILKNLIVEYRRYFDGFKTIRDSMMADNIFWLKMRYPNEKIIIWAASSHLIKDTKSINNKDYQYPFMGTYLHQYFANRYYFMAFTCFEGLAGYKNSIAKFRFRKANPGSIEYYIKNKYLSDYVVLSLRDSTLSKDINNGEIFKSKLLWRKEIEMAIADVCDGLFYINYMTPKTKL